MEISFFDLMCITVAISSAVGFGLALGFYQWQLVHQVLFKTSFYFGKFLVCVYFKLIGTKNGN